MTATCGLHSLRFRTFPEGPKWASSSMSDSVVSLMNDASRSEFTVSGRICSSHFLLLLKKIVFQNTSQRLGRSSPFFTPGLRGLMRCIDVAGRKGGISARVFDFEHKTYGDRETDAGDINGEILKEGQKTLQKRCTVSQALHGSYSWRQAPGTAR
ncbi:hypothetical protein EI94DRAFT_1717599 [Lactarius quietus]|nr:hypothetical protein EI94DRAFT_1717599 [Lactarius quietus]